MTRLEQTTTLQQYRDELARAATELMPDSHVGVYGSALMADKVWPPFIETWVEDRPLLREVTPNAAPLARWDELLEIDGEPLTARVAALLPLTPGSRDDGRRLRALEDATTRPGGPHQVTVLRANGKRETHTVTWDDADAELLFETPRPPPHFKGDRVHHRAAAGAQRRGARRSRPRMST